MKTVTLVVLDSIECDTILRVLPVIGVAADDSVEGVRDPRTAPDDDPASYAAIRRRISGLAEKRARDENAERQSEPLSRSRLVDAVVILRRLRERVAEQADVAYWIAQTDESIRGRPALQTAIRPENSRMAGVLAEERARVLPDVDAALGVAVAAMNLASDAETVVETGTYSYR